MLQHLEGDYGMYTWPCAPVLARYVYSQREYVKGKGVLEVRRRGWWKMNFELYPNLLSSPQLGAGTAIPGIVAAKLGAHVTLSDREGNPQLIKNLRHACAINELSDVQVVSISWGVFSPTVLQLEPPDIILASDCFYDSKGKL